MINPVEQAAQWLTDAIGVEVPAYRLPMVKMALETLGKGDAAAGFQEITRGNRNAAHQLTSTLAIAETYFFRHPGHFEALRTFARERLAAKRSCTVLSAGCSSGEETWSAAAVLADVFPENATGWSVTGCDVSLERTGKAQAGFYRAWSLRQGMAGYDRFFVPRNEGWEVAPALKTRTRFEARNLIAGDFNFGRTFDVIFFRNVSIYWKLDQTRKVLEQLSALLAPDGLFMAGPSDPFPLPASEWEGRLSGGDLVYRRRPVPSVAVAAHPALAATIPARPRLPDAMRLDPPPHATPDPLTSAGNLDQVKVLAGEGRFPEALKKLMAEGTTKTTRHRLWEGILRQSLGENSEALRIFRMCVYLEPDEPLFHRWHAAALVSLDRHDEAARECKLAEELEEGS